MALGLCRGWGGGRTCGQTHSKNHCFEHVSNMRCVNPEVKLHSILCTGLRSPTSPLCINCKLWTISLWLYVLISIECVCAVTQLLFPVINSSAQLRLAHLNCWIYGQTCQFDKVQFLQLSNMHFPNTSLHILRSCISWEIPSRPMHCGKSVEFENSSGYKMKSVFSI